MPSPPRPRRASCPDRRYTGRAGRRLSVIASAPRWSPAIDRSGPVAGRVAAVMLAVAAVSDLVFSPRLEWIGRDDRVVHHPVAVHPGRLAVGRDRLDRGRVPDAGWACATAHLEIDAGEVLAEFSRRSLSTPTPDEARDLLLSFRPG